MSLLLQLPWPTLPPSWPAWNDSEINQTHISWWWWWEGRDISKQGVLVALHSAATSLVSSPQFEMLEWCWPPLATPFSTWKWWGFNDFHHSDDFDDDGMGGVAISKSVKILSLPGGEGADFLVDLILYRESNLKWQWTPKSDHKFNHSWQCQDFHGFWLINNDEKINSDESIWHFVHWYLFCTPQDQQWKWGSKYELDLPKKISWEKLN